MNPEILEICDLIKTCSELRASAEPNSDVCAEVWKRLNRLTIFDRFSDRSFYVLEARKIGDSLVMGGPTVKQRKMRLLRIIRELEKARDSGR